MIRIEKLAHEHIEWARVLHNDPEVLGMLTDPRIVTPEQQEAWFAKLQASKSSVRQIAFIDDVPFSVIRLDQIDYDNKSVCVGLDIHKDFRGKKLAKPLYQEIFKEWFEDRGFHRVWLMVASYNTRAVNLYTSLGMTREGTQREALLKEGVYHDYHIMSILEQEYVKQKASVEKT